MQTTVNNTLIHNTLKWQLEMYEQTDKLEELEEKCILQDQVSLSQESIQKHEKPTVQDILQASAEQLPL